MVASDICLKTDDYNAASYGVAQSTPAILFHCRGYARRASGGLICSIRLAYVYWFS
jgi:hypothetical protein